MRKAEALFAQGAEIEVIPESVSLQMLGDWSGRMIGVLKVHPPVR